MYKTGIFNWFGYIQPIEDRLKMIKEVGFDSVMLFWEDEDYPKHIDRSSFVALAKQYALDIDNIHLPYDNCHLYWSDNTLERDKYINRILAQLEGCKGSGADKVVMHTTSIDNASNNFSIGYKAFEQIIKFTEDIKLKIAIENTPKSLYTDFILTEFKSDYVGFCYDSSHDFIKGETMGKMLSKWKDRLMCVHLSDNDGLADRHWLPEKGYIDFTNIIHIIKETQCDSFSMEVYPYEDEKKLTPEEFLNKAHKAITKLII